jgi:hypothetical protein
VHPAVFAVPTAVFPVPTAVSAVLTALSPAHTALSPVHTAQIGDLNHVIVLVVPVLVHEISVTADRTPQQCEVS